MTTSAEFYLFYIAAYKAVRVAGKIRPQHIAILQAATPLRENGWQIVGVTHAALAHMAARDFKDAIGLHRAHIRPQADFLRESLERSEPFTEKELDEFLDAHDRTILATKAENAAPVLPEYISLEGASGGIRSGSWSAVILKPGRKYLSDLYDKAIRK